MDDLVCAGLECGTRYHHRCAILRVECRHMKGKPTTTGATQTRRSEPGMG